MTAIRTTRGSVVIVALVAVSMLAVVAGPGSAGAKTKRVERIDEIAYSEPTVGVAFPAYNMVTCDSGCPVFDVYRGDRYVSLEVTDAVSPDAAIAVFPWDGATGEPRYTEHHYCTSTDKPLRLPRWTAMVWVEVLIGPCSDGTPATATHGLVTATFSNLP